MPRSVKRRSLKNKRGGAYGGGDGNTSFAPIVPGPLLNTQRGGSKRQSRKNRRQTYRKQKRSRKQRKSFLSTLNQMGGYIRDGSTQFFKRLQGEN